ncbi:MAG: SNF2-related protein, partial [Pseudomonadota bacterium]
MSEFVVGQRWVSHAESNLGLGIVSEVLHRRVLISFPAIGDERTYASTNSPLARVIYKKNDVVKDIDGETFIVDDLIEKNGIVFYKVITESGEPTILPELELDCFVQFNSPKDRLLSGHIDPYKQFALRQKALEHVRTYQQTGVQGLLGPRVQLLPHQIYIAHQVANRKAPRVLLADEVGLGKTIEAGLILHQQLQSGRAQRVLVLVPDSLLHQWLVEMRRRFNLPFSILNEMMCEDAFAEGENPFLASQLVLCPLSFLVENPERDEQALACDWDVLVVDEAHHLEWAEDKASEEYECVERLAERAQGVLLLTATPEQLGVEGHFARLRLLDPDRYYDLPTFVNEDKD